ncbi:MAG: tetratricopeptide repeat protein [Fimbriimonadales bacterium]|nr:tetratricopeptide repeat protein [Fimbriimonadales bacterium]
MTVEKLLRNAEAALAERDMETLRQCVRRLHMARHPEAYYYEAAMLELEGDKNAAVEALRKGVRAFPREFELRHDLIELLLRLHRPEEALQVCEEAIASFSEVQLLTLYVQKARLLSQLERYEEAIATIDAAEQVPPSEYRTDFLILLEPLRLELLANRGDYEGARATLRMLETLAQQNPDHDYLQASVYAGQALLALRAENNPAKARALAEQALQYNRAFPLAVSLYYETGEKVPDTVRLYKVDVVSRVLADEAAELLRVAEYVIAARSEAEAKSIALNYERDAIPGSTEILQCSTGGSEEKRNVPIGIVQIRDEHLEPEEIPL